MFGTFDLTALGLFFAAVAGTAWSAAVLRDGRTGRRTLWVGLTLLWAAAVVYLGFRLSSLDLLKVFPNLPLLWRVLLDNI